jgi:hypothetical protein
MDASGNFLKYHWYLLCMYLTTAFGYLISGVLEERRSNNLTETQ